MHLDELHIIELRELADGPVRIGDMHVEVAERFLADGLATSVAPWAYITDAGRSALIAFDGS